MAHRKPEFKRRREFPSGRRCSFLTSAPIVLLFALPGSSWASCPVAAIGLDTTRAAGSSASTFWGKALGQTFDAPTRGIRSITVWRITKQDSLAFGLSLWICNVDTTGMPLPQSVLLDGATFGPRYGDGVHPLEFRFDFDPPFILPAAGKYCFLVRVDPCWGWSDYLADANNDYPGGSLWRTGRSLQDCFLRPYPENIPNVDLCFGIEFCDAATPVRQHTWGELKVRYR